MMTFSLLHIGLWPPIVLHVLVLWLLPSGNTKLHIPNIPNSLHLTRGAFKTKLLILQLGASIVKIAELLMVCSGTLYTMTYSLFILWYGVRFTVS
jgi:hypothetical protein